MLDLVDFRDSACELTPSELAAESMSKLRMSIFQLFA